ncbi:MAG: hypothetical protein IIY06_09960 [Proteobacteria bacterium]|nr:hypothetical protein [Pseudomonadota bacterium]
MMQKINHATNARNNADYRYLSDAACKQLLGDKLILACILKGCIPEFKDCEVSDIENECIEGEPEIGTVGVHAETTNKLKNKRNGKIHGMNNENATDTEGRITFDIRFYALTPAKDRVKLIINVEAQNDYYPGYPLIKRAIYYGCRQISAQYDSEFEHAHYENIKKVYSIWICFDPPKTRRNTITMYQITEKQVVGEVYEVVALYDLMSIIMICLGTKKDERYTGLLKLLDVWMSEHSIDEKGAVLQSEFNTALPARLLEKEVNMCNYSEFVWNRGIKKGIKKGKAEDLVNLMHNFKLTLEQALRGLSIPESEWDDYRELVKKLDAHPAS